MAEAIAALLIVHACGCHLGKVVVVMDTVDGFDFARGGFGRLSQIALGFLPNLAPSAYPFVLDQMPVRLLKR